MEVAAKLKNVRLSPQKARLVADQVRGLNVEKAFDILQFSPKKAATLIKKALHSAVANAENNEGADIDELVVTSIFVDKGPTFKRFRARAKGRANQILKPTCHITVKVSDTTEERKG